MSEQSLAFSSSSQGVYAILAKGLSVSSCGQKVWACQIQQRVKSKYVSRLAMLDFESDSCFLYDYEHPRLVGSVLVSEAFDVAVSGGKDETLVLHGLRSGKTLKTVDMKHGYLRSLLDLGTAVAVGDEHTLRFLDLETQEMDHLELKAKGDYIKCMGLATGSHTLALLVGADKSNRVTKLPVPQTIAGLARDILDIRGRPPRTGTFQRKLVLLTTENRRLRQENQALKDQLKQKEQDKKEVTSKFENKILDLSSSLERLEVVHAQLQEDLQRARKQVAVLKSPRTRSDAVKRSLMVCQLLRPNRQVSTEDPGEDSDDPFALNKRELQGRLEILETKTRKQRDRIYDLEVENDSLRDKRNNHQRLLRNYDKLLQRLKAIKKSNREVHGLW